MRQVIYWLGILAFLVAGFILGHAYASQQAVCHSVTEDSVITDCSYDHGEWRLK